MVKLAHSYSALKTFEQCPKKYYALKIAKSFKDQGGTASDYGDRIHKALEKRLKENKKLPQEAERYEPICKSIIEAANAKGAKLEAEREMTLNDNFEPTTWFGHDAWLRCKLDVLVCTDKTAVVMDWKTGKRKPDMLQLELNALTIFMHYPDVNKVKVTFVWLQTMEQDTETFTREQLPDMFVNLNTRVAKIERALKLNDWPAQQSGLCGYCPVTSCAHHR
jgi:hypothetical protein